MQLLTTQSGQILAMVFLTLNLLTFFMMAHDKHKSRGRKTKRTPEGLIFFLASMFGGIGVYLAMLMFRHKTRKWYFRIGIPLLILQNLATVYVIWLVVISVQ